MSTTTVSNVAAGVRTISEGDALTEAWRIAHRVAKGSIPSWRVQHDLQALSIRLPLWTIVGSDGSAYIRRWTVATLSDGSVVYLHQIVRSDEDLALHSHPWAGTSWLLDGEYSEERRTSLIVPPGRLIPNVTAPVWQVSRKTYVAGEIVTLRADTYHRLDLHRGPVWTLFVVGPKAPPAPRPALEAEGDSWFFWDRNSGIYTPWRMFLKAKGIVPLATPREHATPGAAANTVPSCS